MADEPISDWLLPQIYRDLIAVVGREAAFRLCGHALAASGPSKNRGWLYVPANQWATTYATYTSLIGRSATDKLVAEFAGEQFEINLPGSWLDAQRNRAIIRTWQSPDQRHLTTSMVGFIHGITGRQVQNIVRGIARAEA